jgi:hypothetical protein
MTAHGSVGGIAHGQRELPTGLSPFETLLELERWIVRANSYADSRKNKSRFLATVVKLLSLVLSAVATVILGPQDLDFWAGLACSLAALTTVNNVEGLYRRYKTIWDDLSLQWLEHRRGAGSGQG